MDRIKDGYPVGYLRFSWIGLDLDIFLEKIDQGRIRIFV